MIHIGVGGKEKRPEQTRKTNYAHGTNERPAGKASTMDTIHDDASRAALIS
jgi:hypothetical protein